MIMIVINIVEKQLVSNLILYIIAEVFKEVLPH